MATNDVLQIHIPSGRWYNRRTGNIIKSAEQLDVLSDYEMIYVCASCYTTHNKISSKRCKKICTIKSQLPDYDGHDIYISRNNLHHSEVYISSESEVWYDTLSSVINNYLIEMQVNKTLKKKLSSTTYLLYHYDLTMYTSVLPSDIIKFIMELS